MTNDQVLMTKEAPNTKDKGSSLLTVDGREDENEFISFLPDRSGGFGMSRAGFRNHPKPVLSLFGFLFAGANLVHELLLGNSFIRLGVVGSNASRTPHNLSDQRSGDAVFSQCATEHDNLFSKHSGSLRKIIFTFRHSPESTTKALVSSRLSLVIEALGFPWALVPGQWSFHS
jgi:hypothetical protein